MPRYLPKLVDFEIPRVLRVVVLIGLGVQGLKDMMDLCKLMICPSIVPKKSGEVFLEGVEAFVVKPYQSSSILSYLLCHDDIVLSSSSMNKAILKGFEQEIKLVAENCVGENVG
ncbi:hypothetical protein LIER_23137 [Lithospermum erythrorhizon]|uniref:Uncharacterized protein n=1 Tax=Lithospermum erythrorhizon TaxID=34254 RepID=A0AAV3QYN0_LITER